MACFCTILPILWWNVAEICIFLPFLAAFCLILQSTYQNSTKESQNDHKRCPKWAEMGQKWTKKRLTNYPKGLKMGSKRHQNDPKWWQNDAKMIPKWHQNDTGSTPKWSKTSIVWPKQCVKNSSKTVKQSTNNGHYTQTVIKVHKNTQNPLRILPDTPTCCTLS